MPKRTPSLPSIGGFKPGGIFLVPTDVPSNITPDWLDRFRATSINNEPSEAISLPFSFEPNTTWAYLTLNGQELNAENTVERLNQLGKESWELCGIVQRSNGEIWIFKRPIKDSVTTK